MNKHFIWILAVFIMISCNKEEKLDIPVDDGAHITLIGGNLGSRMMNYGHFETEMQLAYPEKKLIIRNMCDGGDTPGFRPHSSRKSPWAFPGAEAFYDEETKGSGSRGDFMTPDEWLTHLNTDYILAFFGFTESYAGYAGLSNYKDELRAFIDHTLAQKYNGNSPAKLILISPTHFEDLSAKMDLPDGVETNKNLEMYTKAMAEVALEKGVPFLNIYDVTKTWNDYTVDGLQLSDSGYEKLGEYLVDHIFTGQKNNSKNKELVHDYVQEKNWMWHNDIKVPNGVHVYGRRYEPFGPDNYPNEIDKIRAMTSLRDSAIWSALEGIETDLEQKDESTPVLPPVETNYKPKNIEDQAYKYGDDALATITVAEGYKIELFASEKEFPDLANPVQVSFDDKGRLWVAVMPSYPHYKPGDKKPNDKILIFEDTDNDGKADKQTVFADKLHLPIGFEIAPEGVYISQGTNLKLLIDTDGDDHADKEEILLSGFDDHDTHHAISAFTADPSGAIYMGEGVFLHTSVETPYGTIRGTNGGFFRYDPAKKKLERTANLPIPNPWGIAFDDWGQNFFIHTSGPDFSWMMPSTVKPRYGFSTPLTEKLIKGEHRVRPTSGIEFVSSRHFPDDVQGDLLVNNTIGFLGTKQHRMLENGTGYGTEWVQDLIRSTDGNFRPVDLEFAPDGSLYIADWHNILIGHMQHNARDPLRDHAHGRIYRVTYPSRPLVEPAKVYGASIEELLENLKLPEYRTRYRSKRVLRGKDSGKVMSALSTWIDGLDQSSPEYERLLLEGLWVSWGANSVDEELLKKLLKAQNFRVRTAAVRVLRYNTDKVSDYLDLFKAAANDENSRVRLETMVAASWLSPKEGNSVFNEIALHPLDDWMKKSYQYGLAHLNNRDVSDDPDPVIDSSLKDEELASYIRGKEIYERESYCQTCHQSDGNGLVSSGYPPLKNSEWVTESAEVLARIVLHGIYGPITVNGQEFPGQVPMPPYQEILNDQEIADVLTFVRNSFGNKASVVSPDLIKRLRNDGKEGYYTAEELLKSYDIQ
ncbi:PVC-type heme-binding CxxCH protein [Portibacter lacus]|uniref:Cytochrome c n=1 Tax=Portibacter lacus TaxID=1099794 RepID=A0AA37SPJ6_9BACT|nr:PVC-type heme-binding CxxCH protein [Portibacter lacus]GLR16428.1 cytochrome c [Portibacter lacus]